jgi:hypothetical protein
MSEQIPLKLSKGHIVAFASGDTVPVANVPADNITQPAENKSGVSILTGQPTAAHSSGTGFVLASAAALATQAVGLATAAVIAGVAVAVQTAGTFSLSDWTSITDASILLPRAIYYLDTTAGKLTAIAPTTLGSIVQRIGVAISPTTLDVRPEQSILL